jgi:hypothetical protein
MDEAISLLEGLLKEAVAKREYYYERLELSNSYKWAAHVQAYTEALKLMAERGETVRG